MGKEESKVTPKNLELQTINRSNIVSQTDASLHPTLDLGSYLKRPGREWNSVHSAVAEMTSHYHNR